MPGVGFIDWNECSGTRLLKLFKHGGRMILGAVINDEPTEGNPQSIQFSAPFINYIPDIGFFVINRGD